MIEISRECLKQTENEEYCNARDKYIEQIKATFKHRDDGVIEVKQ